MAQICRVNKSEIPVLIRILCGNYRCCKRRQSNYYDVLRIPQDATQKEIKDAFIKLSKEMHPDCGSKGNHNDFIKLNEAYSILSKKDSRYYYDNNLKYKNSMNCNYSVHFSGPGTFYDLNEFQNKKYAKKDLRKAVGFCIGLMIFGFIIQMIRIKMWSDLNRYALFERNMRYELEYRRSRTRGK